MARSHTLSSRGKALAISASVLFIVLAVIWYTRYADNASASILIVQEDGPSPVDVEDTKNQQADFKGKQNFLKDMQHELKEIQKETKNTVNTTTVDGLISKFSSCIATIQPKIGSTDYWDLARDCGYINNDVETELQDNLRPARDCHQNKRGIEDRKKEKKNNVDRQIKDILRNNKNADVSGLTALAAKMDEQFAKATAVTVCTSDGNDILQDVSSELNSLFQDFYNTSSDVSNMAEEARQLKENQKDFDSNFKKNCNKQLKREFDDYEKEIGKLQKKVSLTADQQAAHENVKSIYADLCTTIIANMEQALAANDNETFQGLRQDFWTKETDFRNEANELRRAWNESEQIVQEQEQKEESLKNVTRDLKQKKRDLTRMQKELKRTNKFFNRAAKKYLDKAERKEALASFAGYIAQAADLIARIETGLASAREEAESDPDAYWSDRNEELNDLQNEFNELQSNIQTIAQSLQTIKEVERVLKSAKKDLASLRRESQDDPELMKGLENLLSQAQELLQQAWSLLVTDAEEAMETLQDIQQLENDWNTTIEDWRERTYDNGEGQ